MRRIGVLTTATLTGIALGVAYVGLRSIPDIQRYLKIRAM